MGILPDFNKIGSPGLHWAGMGTCRTVALLTYFFLATYLRPSPFNLRSCVESFHGEGSLCSSAAIRVSWLELSHQLVNKPAPPAANLRTTLGRSFVYF